MASNGDNDQVTVAVKQEGPASSPAQTRPAASTGSSSWKKLLTPNDSASLRQLLQLSIYMRTGQGVAAVVAIILVAIDMGKFITPVSAMGWNIAVLVLYALYSGIAGFLAFQVHKGGGDMQVFSKVSLFGSIIASYALLSAFSAGAALGIAKYATAFTLGLVIEFVLFIVELAYIPYAKGIRDNADLFS